MDSNKKQIQELIDRYLMGQMDQPEHEAFEKELIDNPELQQEVELTRHIIQGLQHETEKAAFEAMKNMPEAEFKKLFSTLGPSKKASNRTMLVRISTAVAAAVICLLIYTGTRPAYTPEQLFADYYITQPYETYGHRGDKDLTPEQVDMLKEAKRLYEEKEYTQALAIYNREFLEKTDRTSLPKEILFHAAICEFETGETAGSIKKLTDLIASKDTDFRKETLWNLSLIYLKTNQRRKAKECLIQLIEMDSDYTVKASELLQKLNDKRWF